jgi:hypothetical protein
LFSFLRKEAIDSERVSGYYCGIGFIDIGFRALFGLASPISISYSQNLEKEQRLAENMVETWYIRADPDIKPLLDAASVRRKAPMIGWETGRHCLGTGPLNHRFRTKRSTGRH